MHASLKALPLLSMHITMCFAAQVQQTGAIIMAACSAAFAAVVAAFVVQCSQGRAPCELLHDGIFGVPVYAPRSFMSCALPACLKPPAVDKPKQK